MSGSHATPPSDADAAVAFRDSLVPRADEMAHGKFPLWHGWALYDAFIAGVSFARSESAPIVQCPTSHEAATKRIGECVREIEMIADTFGYDPYQWLVSTED